MLPCTVCGDDWMVIQPEVGTAPRIQVSRPTDLVPELGAHKLADEDRIRLSFEQAERGNYISIFGFLEFVLKHRAFSSDLHKRIDSNLRYCRAVCWVVDK